MARTYFKGKDQSADLDNASEVLVTRDDKGAITGLEVVLGLRHLKLDNADDVKQALGIFKEIPAAK